MKLSLVALSLAAVSLFALSADARKPEDVFGGRAMVSESPYPTKANSEEDFINRVKSQSKDRFNEDKENKEWRIFIAAFFKAPAGSVEVTIKFYDVTSGQRLVETFEQYVSSEKARAYITDVRLKRGDGTSLYDPNSKIHMQIEAKGKVIAESTFFLVGEARKYSGKVDFSDDKK